MGTNSLAIFTKAALMLAEADTIQKAHELKDLALTAADFARRKGMGEEAVKHCRSYALEAERKMGEMLAVKPPAVRGKPGTGRGKKGSSSELPAFSNDTPTLAELGLTKRESSEAQTMASIPREVFEEIKEGKKSKKSAIHEVRRADIQQAHADAEKTTLPSNKYRVIYADPPWKYSGDFMDQYGHAQGHYKTMTIDELCEMPVFDLSLPNSVLFLWATSPKLKESLKVMEAWGFEYKTSFVWDKIKHNFGYYNSVRHEFLLIGGKGRSTPDAKELHDSVIEIERDKIHSHKPEYFRELIDKLYTSGKRIELFSRGRVPENWDSWGIESA